MTLYYLDNQDCSGIFSSVEKAKESYFNFINRCGWKHIKESRYEYADDAIDLFYVWERNGGKVKGIASIIPYELDEDNG